MMSSIISLLRTFLLFLLLHPPPPHAASSFRLLQPPNPPAGLNFEEKTRLGSTPPSCHNKCNGCHPCMAVQVPSISSHEQFEGKLNRETAKSMQNFDPSSDQYSNYKPLGWKCHCRDHFYNP